MKQKAKGRHRRPSAVQKAAQRAQIAAPVAMVSGAMVAAPALMLPQAHHQGHQAFSHTMSHTITAHSDAVVRANVSATARTSSTAQTASTYTVQRGDTLYGIAARCYGHGDYWHGLYQANKSKISNPNLIFSGQKLTIPPRHEVCGGWHPSTSGSSTSGSSTSGSSTSGSSTSGSSTTRSSSSGSSSTGSSWAGSSSGSSASSPTADVATSGSSTSGSSTSGGSATSSGVSSAVQKDITSGNNLLAVAQYLVDNGYSKAAAAGVASCIDGESAGNPESEGSGGGGLIGWTPLGSAQPNANIITGNPATDMITQLQDILFYNASEIGQTWVTQLNSQTDPVAAADFFSQHFEKPAVTDSDVRANIAEQIFTELGG